MKYPKEKVKDILFKLNFELPKDYLNYIISNDGVVENHLNYIDLWPLDILFFGYISCPDVCPTTFSKLTRVYALLGAEGKDVLTVFVSVDPQRDTTDKIKEYLQYFKTKNLDYI